jgi:hypothetical protein
MKKTIGFFLVFTFVLALISTGPGCTSHSQNTSTLPPASEVPYKDLVENFIKSDATYAFDGIEGSLKFLKTIGSTSGNKSIPTKEWEYTVEYQTLYPGEGDRTGLLIRLSLKRRMDKSSQPFVMISGI